MTDEDPQKLADELEHDADKLEDHSGEVQQRVDDARQEWERKRADQQDASAAQPPPSDDDES